MERTAAAAAAAAAANPELDSTPYNERPLFFLFIIHHPPFYQHRILCILLAPSPLFLQSSKHSKKKQAIPVRPLYTRNKRSITRKNKNQHKWGKARKRSHVIYREWLGRGWGRDHHGISRISLAEKLGEPHSTARRYPCYCALVGRSHYQPGVCVSAVRTLIRPQYGPGTGVFDEYYYPSSVSGTAAPYCNRDRRRGMRHSISAPGLIVRSSLHPSSRDLSPYFSFFPLLRLAKLCCWSFFFPFSFFFSLPSGVYIHSFLTCRFIGL